MGVPAINNVKPKQPVDAAYPSEDRSPEIYDRVYRFTTRDIARLAYKIMAYRTPEGESWTSALDLSYIRSYPYRANLTPAERLLRWFLLRHPSYFERFASRYTTSEEASSSETVDNNERLDEPITFRLVNQASQMRVRRLRLENERQVTTFDTVPYDTQIYAAQGKASSLKSAFNTTQGTATARDEPTQNDLSLSQERYTRRQLRYARLLSQMGMHRQAVMLYMSLIYSIGTLPAYKKDRSHYKQVVMRHFHDYYIKPVEPVTKITPIKPVKPHHVDTIV